MKLQRTISDYLEDIGLTDARLTAGGRREVVTKKERFDRLLLDLDAGRQQSGKMVWILTGSFILCLFSVIVVGWIHRDNEKFLLAILVSGNGTILLLLNWLRAVWREVAVLDMLRAILPGATMEEAVKALTAVNAQMKTTNQSSSVRARAKP